MEELILTREEVRRVDQIAIEEFKLPGLVLMENAGRGAVDVLGDPGGPVVICCGKGNNGGDGFVMARHLENRGFEVEVVLFNPVEEYSGDAATNLNVLLKAETSLSILSVPEDLPHLATKLSKAAWVVDALLGTGLSSEVREPYRGVIETINASGRPVLAVDLPSGLDCDRGEPLGICVHATRTATFVARKPGLTKSNARQYFGAVHVVDIGIPRRLLTLHFGRQE